jgi:hypothetical protein
MSGNGKISNTHGRMRLEAVLRARPGKPLEHGETLLLHHALRCLCKLCKKLIKWENGDDEFTLSAECCGLAYRLLPRSVVVEIKDVSSRPILPAMRGSDYSDPGYDLSPFLEGNETAIEGLSSRPLTGSQRDLRETSKIQLTQSEVDPKILVSSGPGVSEPGKIKLKVTFGEARNAK